MIRPRLLAILIVLVGILSGCEKSEQSTEEIRPPSAQDNVFVLSQSFEMPGLDRTRKIRVYLPPGYDNESSRYPVMYMHDAQNLFDDATSYAGEWKVDETLNKLAKTHGLKLIVVGIDNGQDKRLTELSAWDHPEYGNAEGKQYLAFITEVIKPFIDAEYRTKPDATNTAIMGSSMGGLMSFYAIYSHPEIFTKAGIFSPSFWYSPDVFEFAQSSQLPNSARLDFLVGTEEGGEIVKDMRKMVSITKNAGHPIRNIKSRVVDGAGHNEAFWASEFADSVLWLFREE